MQQNDKVSKILDTAYSYFNNGDANLAMAYFKYASDACIELNQLAMAAELMSKAAYCYVLDERYSEASNDYAYTATLYTQAGMENEANAAQNQANHFKKLNSSL